MAEEYLENSRLLNLPVPAGAEQPEPPTPAVQTYTITGKKLSKDMRVKIRVPDSYFTGLTSGYQNQLKNLKGILFPYTPTISYELKAEYSSAKPMHSNFTINFYQRSSVDSISISGKFTVENRIDAENYLSTIHLLRALTRMNFGPDANAGSPPPVCRLDAYGDMNLINVPVAITNYRAEYNEDVDYYELNGTDYYNTNFVPTRSTVQITCIPMYSRNEMQQFSVKSYLSNRGSKGFI